MEAVDGAEPEGWAPLVECENSGTRCSGAVRAGGEARNAGRGRAGVGPVSGRWQARPRLCPVVPATGGPAMGTEQPSVPHSTARLCLQADR